MLLARPAPPYKLNRLIKHGPNSVVKSETGANPCQHVVDCTTEHSNFVMRRNGSTYSLRMPDFTWFSILSGGGKHTEAYCNKYRCDLNLTNVESRRFGAEIPK